MGPECTDSTTQSVKSIPPLLTHSDSRAWPPESVIIMLLIESSEIPEDFLRIDSSVLVWMITKRRD